MVKKVAFVIGSLSRGGAERVISILANYYVEKGWNVDILLLLNGECGYELKPGINIYNFSNINKSRINQLPFWIKNIRKYTKTQKPDCIVSFVGRINIITLMSCLGLKCKIVVSERNDPGHDGRSASIIKLTKWLYKIPNKVIFQTKYQSDFFHMTSALNSRIIENPVKEFINSDNLLMKKVVSVGRLSEQKNHFMFIDSIEKLLPVVKDEYDFIIYGDGELRKAIEARIEEKDLTSTVHLAGNIPDISKCIQNAECFVMCSDFEGMSNALLEALSLGLACVTTRWNGADEIIQNGYNGLLVPLNDTEAMAEAIKKIITDKEYAEILRKNAVISSKKYSIDQVITKWEDAIEK